MRNFIPGVIIGIFIGGGSFAVATSNVINTGRNAATISSNLSGTLDKYVTPDTKAKI
jgi:hypothetical protein